MDETVYTEVQAPEKDSLVVALENTVASLVRRNEELQARLDHRFQQWSEAERLYLVQLHLADMNMRNPQLALRCTVKFGRTITTNSVRGALDRARLAGIIPPKRPNTKGVTRHEIGPPKYNCWSRIVVDREQITA